MEKDGGREKGREGRRRGGREEGVAGRERERSQLVPVSSSLQE